MPFLTPNVPPDDLRVCRRIKIPAQTDWLSLVTGALAVLTKPYNFELAGTSSIEDTTQFFEQMLTDYVDSTDFCMIGSIFPYITSMPPANCLLCDGSSYLRIYYPDLYAALDPAFIIDADNFVVPDLRDKTVIGAGNGGGSYTPRIVGEIGGEETHQLIEDELAAHLHTSPPHGHSDAGHSHVYNPPGVSIPVVAPGEVPVTAINLLPGVTSTGFASITATAATIDSTGGDAPHNNMQPFLALNYCVVAR